MDLSARIAALNDFASKVGFDAVPEDAPEHVVIGLEAVAASYRQVFPVGHIFHEDSPTESAKVAMEAYNEVESIADALIAALGSMNALRLVLAISPERQAKASSN